MEPKNMIVEKNLVYLYFLLHPSMTVKRISFQWGRCKILKEYPEPPVEALARWITEFREEVKVWGREKLKAN